MGGWHRERMKCHGSGRIILKICIIYILRNRFQFTCTALMGFREVTILEESQLVELKMR